MSDTTYLTLTELRSFNGIPASGEDTQLQLLLNAAASLLDSYCNTTFVSTAVTLELHDGDGSRYLKLRHRPIISVSDVQVSGSSISSSTYAINYEAGFLIIPDWDADSDRDPRVWRSTSQPGWPTGDRNLAVSYSYGYSGDVPDDVKAACGMIAASLYTEDQRRGVQSEAAGPYSATYALDYASIPAAARALLSKYREVEIGA